MRLLVLLLVLIIILMGFYYFSDKTTINANVIKDSENKLPGKDSLGSYVCEDGTSLYLPFDLDLNDKSKNLIESKTNSVNLVAGKFSNASYFKLNSNLEIPLNLTEEAITLSFWFKIVKNNSQILDIIYNNKSLLSISYQNKLLINYKSNPIDAALIDDNWHSLVVLINPQENKLNSFLDNVFLGSNYINKDKISMSSLHLGGNNFTGEIDDLIIYNFALENNKISDIYNNGTGKPACVFIPECVDSDGGINQNEKGIVFTKLESKEDYCLLEGDIPKYVNEYYCLGNQIVSKVMDCPKNCFNGACTP